MTPEDENTVLIVSDTPDQLDQISVQLRQAGYHVLTASVEREGYQLARRSRPSLIISNVLMSRPNGIELCRLMRADVELRNVPILLISAIHKDMTSVIEGVQTGADDYLQAPYDPLLLIAKVTRLVERRRAEAHYCNVVEQASDIIYEHDLKGQLTSINAAGTLFLGRSCEELVGTHFGTAFGLSDPETQVKATIDKLRQAGARRVQIEARDARGRQRCLDISLMLICSRNGEAVGVRGIARDITERKRAEEARAQLAAIVESSDDAIIGRNLDGLITSWNKGAERIFGYSAEEVRGRPITILVPPERHDEVTKSHERIKRGESVEGYETVRICKDGRLINVSITVSPIKDDSGNITGASVIARDITEQKQVEDKLRRQALIFENLTDAIIITDPQRRITDWNPAAERIFGYSKEEVLGKTPDILHKPHEIDVLREKILEGVAREDRWIGEINFVRKDGTEGVCETFVIPLFDERGKQIARIGVNRDITNRKRAEEALRRAETRAIIEYERLLDRLASLAQAFGTARDLTAIFRALQKFAVVSVPCSSILISLYDHERDAQRPVYAWSEGAEVDVSTMRPLPVTNSPHSHAMLTGEVTSTNNQQAATIDQLIHNTELEMAPRQPHLSHIMPMIAMGRTLGTIEVRCAEPATFETEHATAMRMAANLAAVAIENVQLFERERERAGQEAESDKMRSLGQLAAGVAHDFNNSLAAILGRTQLLLRSITDEKQRRSLQVIETASLDAAETVRRIQTFARRAPDGQLSPVSIARLITDAIQLTRTRWEDDARAHGLRYDIHFTPASEGSDQIAANPSEVREVFVNLILNALDAMPSGGEISFKESKASDFITVEVKDTGIGVPPAVKHRIFEPFFTTKGSQGSGLGLAISYGIIHRHGGTIDVESEVGKGTTFILRFPRMQHKAAPSIRKKKTNLPNRRVLVVDDDDNVRNVLAELLKELQQDVIAVSNGMEALDALTTGQFDLMITDLSMPGMDGLTLAAQARQQAPHMMIVLATGYGRSLPDRMIDRSLINMVINKPFQLADIEASLWATSSDRESRQKAEGSKQ